MILGKMPPIVLREGEANNEPKNCTTVSSAPVLVVMMFAMSPGFAIGQGDVKKVTPEPPTPKAGELPPEAKAGDVV